MDLISKYIESWHIVGMGSGEYSPPWIVILAIASLLTFGKVWLFITIFFLFMPSLAFFVMYRSARRFGLSIQVAVIGGLIYGLSPVIWNSINQGRLGTLVIALLAPILLSLMPRTLDFESLSWRRTYSLSLLASLLSAFSSLFLRVGRASLGGASWNMSRSQSAKRSLRSIWSGDSPLAYAAPIAEPALVPAMQSIGTRSDSRTRSTPTWAKPRAPPPESARPTRGRLAGGGSADVLDGVCAAAGISPAANSTDSRQARARAIRSNPGARPHGPAKPTCMAGQRDTGAPGVDCSGYGAGAGACCGYWGAAAG